jgi:hypothetical protein
MNKSKRNFLTGAWTSKRSNTDTKAYFESFESCQPLLADNAALLALDNDETDICIQAKAKGLVTEGKSTEELAAELFQLGFIHPSAQ